MDMKRILLMISLCVVMSTSCSKFLEEAPGDLVIPENIEDLAALFFKTAYPGGMCDDSYLEFMTDDMMVHDVSQQASFNGKPLSYYNDEATHLNNIRYPFSWSDDMEVGLSRVGKGEVNSWRTYYGRINGCNILLDMTDKVLGSKRDKDYQIAQALTLRGYYYLMLVNIYGNVYNHPKYLPTESLGVPLILSMATSDVLPVRNTVQEVYDQIEKDLLKAESLFEEGEYTFFQPHTINLNATRAILSRVYLYMENHDKAIEYATKIISDKRYDLFNISRMSAYGDWDKYSVSVYNIVISNELIWNYGNVANGDKNIFQVNGFNMGYYYSSTISDDLISTYDIRVENIVGTSGSGYPSAAKVPGVNFGDLRPIFYFDNAARTFVDAEKRVKTRPWYANKTRSVVADKQFGGCGMRLSEIYLNRAEAYLKKYIATGDVSFREKGLADLNELRRNRFDRRFEYVPIEVQKPELLVSNDELMKEYWAERRRELVGENNHRWFDLRRSGMPRIVHQFYGPTGVREEFILEQGANGYTVRVPQSAIDLNKNLEQNPGEGSK